MGKTPCCEKVGLNKGLWSAEEDEILRSYIQANGEGSWRSLPKNAGLKRCGKSCRLRWVNYLRGDLIRGNITSEEEDIIIKMHNKIGNRWSVIAGHLPGRTDNEIKNYWNSDLSRRIYTIKRPVGESSSSPTSVMVEVDIVKLDFGFKRKGGTTRTAKKKNNTNSQEFPSNAKIHHGPNIISEYAGKILNSSDDGIETISWSSSPFANGEPRNEILGPYHHGLDQSSMFADDDIMSDELLSPNDILCRNEKDNKINTMSEGESGGGLSLVSNGHGAAESSDEWTNSDREGVEGFNHKLLTNEGGDELFSWLRDNIDSGNEEDMLGFCEEKIKAIAGSLLS